MQPFGDAATFREPLTMVHRDVGAESCDRRDEPNSVPGFRVASKEIVFGEGPDETVTAKQQSKRFEDCTLAGPVRSDEHRLPLAEMDVSTLYPSKVLDAKLPNPHILLVSFHSRHF